MHQLQGEIAVTRRAAYTAEGAVSRLEKDKLEQDFQIDALQVCWLTTLQFTLSLFIFLCLIATSWHHMARWQLHLSGQTQTSEFLLRQLTLR